MKDYFKQTTSAAPLAIFRIGFGIMLLLSIVRFWSNGWIKDFYIKPKFYFPFYGFEFVKPLGDYIYIVFIVVGVSALFVALGLFYRLSVISLFLSFTYIELIDKSTYLNHYYFVSMISFMLILMPAHVYFSIDSYRNSQLLSNNIPRWCLDSIKLFICILYFFAGIAKINSDWLLEALPLKIWLPARNDMPIIGSLFNYLWIWYAFSWFGCIYDLSISFLLWNRRTRWPAFITVIIFHGLTAILFPIGMFPYIMIVTALIFFSGNFHKNIVRTVGKWLRLPYRFINPNTTYGFRSISAYSLKVILAVFFLIQLALPMRYLLYPGELFWTEEGYRFSWRVMLMEKAGYTQFTVKDATGKSVIVNNNEFLTSLQEKMMATQPDMILQYAHILRDYYSQRGFHLPQVYVDSYVALNGRLGKALVSPEVDLAKEKETFKHKNWVTPFSDEIKGF